MRTVRNCRAWRFDDVPAQVPDDAHEPDVGGICLTLAGGISTIDEAESVRQSIRLLLATRPGERVMRPEYGCSLHRLVFSANDASTAGLAIHYIRQAIERWEPRVIIEQIDAGPHLFDARESQLGAETDSHLQIALWYKLSTIGTTGFIGLSFDFATGEQHSTLTREHRI
ncbi:MAG: GPW/gp25 family protein [Planctomycetes bacterium]|nr:GPW/gp25 family protein [Planctomycetota bacterium]